MRKDNSVPKAFQHRRSKRVPLKIRFKVNGRDINGTPFEETVETVDLGNIGGCFHLKSEVKIGSTLKLSGPKGFVCLVRAAWVNLDSRVQRYTLGFQLLETREDWVLQAQTKPSIGPASGHKRRS
jgi:hypothetical protein